MCFLCVCVCVLAEALLSFYAANLNADFIYFWSPASRLFCISVLLVARSGWLVRRQRFRLSRHGFGTVGQLGFVLLLADALQRYCDVFLD